MDSYFDEFIKYRRFTVDKLLEILSNKKFNNARVIITGDHGFRGTSKAASNINPNHTSLYAKGMDISKIKTVQDIAYLINDSFAK